MKPLLPRFMGGFVVAVLVVAGALQLSHYESDYSREQADKPQNQFSAARARQHLQQLFEGMPAHPSGTAANERLKVTLQQALQQLGFQTETQNEYVCNEKMDCGHVSNLIAYRQQPTNKNAILVNVHYDSVTTGPGVSDNGVNLAIALEMARVEQHSLGKNPLLIVFSDAEETGLRGARAFVGHPLAQQVAVVINLDARGTSGRTLMFETSTGNQTLIDSLAANFPGGKTNAIFQEIYNVMPNETDFTVFKDAGMKGFNFGFMGKLQHYHTGNDSLENVDFNSLAEQGIAVSALYDTLSKMDLATIAEHQADSLYMDIGGKTVVSWSATKSLIAGLLLLMIAFYLVFNRRGSEHSPKRAIGGMFAVMVSLLLGVALCFGLSQVIGMLQPVFWAWDNLPTQTKIVQWLGALLLGALIYDVSTRKLSLYEHLSGMVLLFSLVATGLNIIAPGAAYLYLLPAVPVALLLLGSKSIASQLSVKIQACAALFFVAVYAVLATDIAYLVELALGLAWAGFVLALFLTPIGIGMVWMSKISFFERRAMLAGYATAAIVVAVNLYQIGLPLEKPVKEGANLLHFQHQKQAFRLIERSPQRLAVNLIDQLGFKANEKGQPLYALFPRASVSPAAALALPHRVNIERRSLQGDIAQLDVTLRTADVFHFAVVKLPESLSYRQLLINGVDVTPKSLLNVTKEGYREITLYGHFSIESTLSIVYLNKDLASIAAVVIDEHVDQTNGFDNENKDKIWAHYDDHYFGHHKGNRSIVRRHVTL
jgi:hypothetical protein